MRMTDPVFRWNASPGKTDAFIMTYSSFVHCSLFQYLKPGYPAVFWKNTMKNPANSQKPSGEKNVS
jgi:hypothetical protein